MFECLNVSQIEDMAETDRRREEGRGFKSEDAARFNENHMK